LYVYLVIYSVGRFFLEFLRGDVNRGMWLFLSTSQLISILIILAVLIELYLSYKRTQMQAPKS